MDLRPPGKKNWWKLINWLENLDKIFILKGKRLYENYFLTYFWRTEYATWKFASLHTQQIENMTGFLYTYLNSEGQIFCKRNAKNSA